jgi:uncharacterized protein YndB with AHSA1/START domain
MELAFRRTFRAPPEIVWPHLTEPDRMSEWSEARITAVAPGRSGRNDEVGALRRAAVSAFGLVSVLEEEIVESAPPHRYVYRVVKGGGLRDHRGTQTLDPTPEGGTALLWVVSFRALVPGLAPVLGAILRPRLERSLSVLEERLAAR